jgi:hypothetical protein
MLSKYLPSKKVVALLLIPIISLVILFLVNYHLRNNIKTDKEKAVLESLNKTIDTDGDGLED